MEELACDISSVRRSDKPKTQQLAINVQQYQVLGTPSFVFLRRQHRARTILTLVPAMGSISPPVKHAFMRN